MAKTVKNIRLENSLIDQVSALADLEYEGNFTAAMEGLISQSLAARTIEERTKWLMYSAAKQSISGDDLTEKEYHQFITKITEALHI